MVARFLLNNGLKTDDDMILDPLGKIDYPRYESKAFAEILNQRRDFLPASFKSFFSSFKGNFIKAPMAVFWLDEIAKYRDLKVIYIIRNPESVITSTLDKSDKKFITIFYRWCEVYNQVMNFTGDVFTFFVERPDWRGLAKFCELDTVDLNGIKEINPRRSSYFHFRFNNFLLKRLMGG